MLKEQLRQSQLQTKSGYIDIQKLQQKLKNMTTEQPETKMSVRQKAGSIDEGRSATVQNAIGLPPKASNIHKDFSTVVKEPATTRNNRERQSSASSFLPPIQQRTPVANLNILDSIKSAKVKVSRDKLKSSHSIGGGGQGSLGSARGMGSGILNLDRKLGSRANSNEGGLHAVSNPIESEAEYTF